MIQPAPTSPGLNEAHTFESFIVGPENELAARVAVAAAESPGQLYNPLLIYGSPGLGKTHLLHAIAHEVIQKNPSARIVYVSCEDFTDEYISVVRARDDAAKCQRTNEFKRKYRDADMLLISDIQFLSGKVGTQEAFFSIFKHLHLNKRQIILTSDRPVREIRDLSDRLVSRFQGGMTVDIQAPRQETRRAIIEKKTASCGMKFSQEVIDFLAGQIQGDIRNLEGAITRAVAYAKHGGRRDITVPQLKQLLRDILIGTSAGRVPVDRILRHVAERYNLTLADITGMSRTANIARPRQVAMFLCARLTDLSLVAIGEAFGGRDSSVVIRAWKSVENRMEVDPRGKREVENLLRHFDGAAAPIGR